MTLGHSIHCGNFRILWGNRDASIDHLQARHPSLELIKLRQTHSNIVRMHTRTSSAHGLEGDAIISRERNTLLAMSTADCLPVMAAQPATGWMASIHAGWRGVANGIVPKTLELLAAESGTKEGLKIWIGPHIKMLSFEVEADVKDQLLASAPGLRSEERAFKTLADGKYLLDLSCAVVAQIAEAGFTPESLWISSEDTMTTLRYHSHRRDREKSGRQHSFVTSLDLR